MYAIEVEGLTKRYKDFSLEDINLKLPKGTIMGLVGENGAGKSTTIKLIMNAISSDFGKVSVLGVDNKSKEFIEVKQDIGVVLDEAYFPEVLTIKNIEKVMINSYKNWNTELFYNLIKKFNLPTDKMFKEFSRGMKMKLAIAGALAHDTKLLILDEATSGLDPIIRDEVLDVFNEFTRDEEHAILLSSHIVSDLEKICDYIAFIHKGKLVLCEEKDELLEKYSLVNVSNDMLRDLPTDAIVGQKKTGYGYTVLVIKEKISETFVKEKTTLEDIILFLAREDS